MSGKSILLRIKYLRTQTVYLTLLGLKIHCRVHSSPWPYPQPDEFTPNTYTLSLYDIVQSSHLRLGPPSWSLPLKFTD
jgi:hypothetical protein